MVDIAPQDHDRTQLVMQLGGVPKKGSKWGMLGKLLERGVAFHNSGMPAHLVLSKPLTCHCDRDEFKCQPTSPGQRLLFSRKWDVLVLDHMSMLASSDTKVCCGLYLVGIADPIKILW